MRHWTHYRNIDLTSMKPPLVDVEINGSRKSIEHNYLHYTMAESKRLHKAAFKHLQECVDSVFKTKIIS